MVPENFGKKFVDALIHLLNGIIKVALIPFTFWTKSIVNFSEQKKPIYDSTVGLNADFLYDGLTILSYPLGLIYFIYNFIDLKMYDMPFDLMLKAVIFTLILIYLCPVFVLALRYAVKIAWAGIRAIWAVVCKFYKFIVNPHWHIAIKHLKEE